MALSLLAGATIVVIAQEDSLKTVTLKNVSVTAKSKVREQSEQAFAVSVVDMKGEYHRGGPGGVDEAGEEALCKGFA